MVNPQIAIRLPQSLMEKLNTYLERTGTTKTQVIVATLAQYLGSADDIPVMQRITRLEERVAAVEGEGRGN